MWAEDQAQPGPLGGEAAGSWPAHAFTVDLEDWFQGLTSTNPLIGRWPDFESRVVPATRRLLDLLRRYKVRATFFVLGYVADTHPHLVAEVQNEGHEIAVHGYLHRFVNRMTESEFAAEIERSIHAVSRITLTRPRGHRAPYFSVNRNTPWFANVLLDYGLTYDSSIFPIRNMLYGFPGAPRFPFRLANGIVEFPASTVRVLGRNWPIAGGFYVRALPYWFIQRAIHTLQAQGQPAIMYVHPWELDLEQAYPKVTPRERITHYYGRATLAGKLERLFTEFEFAPLEDLMASVSIAGTHPVHAADMPERQMSAD
jgi:polysaccharide deacetylase family protein (PEP-CTERM system associated)